MMKFTTFFLCLSLFVTSVPFALGQTVKSSKYDVELVVKDGTKSKETDAVLTINETNLEVLPDKKSFQGETRNFDFSNIKSADYSYSKKPMLSAGGAVATAIFLGLFAVPFLFVKKKNHWLAVQTDKEFAVLKLDGSNYRQIIAELKTRGIDVKTIEEEKKKDKGK